MDFAIFGAGCFWCVEAIFSQLPGVNSVESGYCNGHTKNPTYEEVCSGATGHAEVCKISYDSSTISYKKLLKVFFQSHNPTTLNRQDADIGTQYRSAIFYINNSQEYEAERYIDSLIQHKIFTNPIVTEVEKLDHFYLAEDYHQNYYKNNIDVPYCKLVIKPKLDKIIKY